MNSIPYAQPSIGEEEIQEVIDTLKSGWLSTGPKTLQFEKSFAEYVGVKHAIGLTSCTAALHLALLAHRIGPGDEVIVPSFTFAASVNTIIHVGATPVFADISEHTYILDIEDVERRITLKTKAIILVHYGGYVADIDAFNALAKKHGLVIIEDAAHAVGSERKGKQVGSFGNTTCFSFYATKTMTTGEGGMVTTDDDAIAEHAQNLRLHGMSKDAWKRYAKGANWRYEIVAAGWKYNMFDLLAALGIHQLKKLPSFIDTRRAYAEQFKEGLGKIPGLILPPDSSDIRHSYHLYPIRISGGRRDGFIETMANLDIGTSVHFIPNHLQPYYRERGSKEGDLPITEKVFSEIVSLPLYPKMTPEEVSHVIQATKKALA